LACRGIRGCGAQILLISSSLFAQVGINKDGNPPDPSAGLDVKFDKKGFLPPRMNTSQRNSIATPATGLIIFNTDCNDIQLFNGTGWVPIGNAGMLATPGAINVNAALYLVPLGINGVLRTTTPAPQIW
jgi:hypothetical protein